MEYNFKKVPLSFGDLLTSNCHSEHNIQRSFANAQDDRCEESLNNEKLTISSFWERVEFQLKLNKS